MLKRSIFHQLWFNGIFSSLYTWSEQCPSAAKDLGVECMPMLWGQDQDRKTKFQSTVVQGYANIAMGFNE